MESVRGGPVLEGRVAMVVGSGPNIGAGIAVELAGAGASVVCVDVSAEYTERAAEEIVKSGGRAVAWPCDVTDERAVAKAVEAAADAFGPVTVLVNGAVRYLTKGIRDITLDEWRSQLSVMLDGAFLCTKYVAEALIRDGLAGSVITLLSTAGHQGEPGNVGYCTGKGGLLNFTRTVAVELAPFGIRVNSLTPTGTDTTEWRARAERWGVPGPPEGIQAQLDAAAVQVPLGSLPRPSDYGAAAVFLASDAARMITGIDLPVDAGSLARYWRRLPGELDG